MASGKAVSNFVNAGKKIVAVGRNFKEHAAELGNAVPTEPVIFLKPTSSYITEGQHIKIPRNVTEIHHEVELGVVVGKTGTNIPESAAMGHVGGYTLALDMTNRAKQTELKKKGLPWSLAKGFDTSCPVSRLIAKEELGDVGTLQLWLSVNGVKKQDGNTCDMIFSVPYLISWISEHFTLEVGDVILTGTPQGVGPVRTGDEIHCGIGNVVDMKFFVK